MSSTARIGDKVPLLPIEQWVQGGALNLDQLLGNVVLIEVFQVNCPGCFLYALPEAIQLHHRYALHGLSVLAIATAFEDFDKNNLENLLLLLEHRQVIGETYRLLRQHNLLIDNRLPYRLPFPVAMDRLQQRENPVDEAEISALINEQAPNFRQLSQSQQQQMWQQASAYLNAQAFRAETFKLFNLRGTPSHILIDKQGVLVSCTFGNTPDLEQRIIALLD